MPSRIGFIARLWFYFRMGYSTYLTFLLGYVTTLITVYYLAIKNMPILLDVFPHFVPFAILATLIGAPLSVSIGWLHLKRSPAYSSEMDIGVEANPYYYKLPPGYNREVWVPVYIELLGQVMRLVESQKLLRPEDKARIEEIQGKLQLLKNGGSVGSPRTRM
jgi:hypothetical protein